MTRRRQRGPVAGVLLWALIVAPLSAGRIQQSPNFDWGPYDLKTLGLGKKATAFIVLGDQDCKDCVASMGFYKSLMKLPGMDGTERRVVVIAKDGVWPVKIVTDAHGFLPHHLTSGPYPRRPVPGVTKAPAIVVLDAKGKERGKWEGLLDASQQKAIVAALTK